MTVKGILTAMLKQEYQNKGYRLYEDEDSVYVKKDNKVLAIFNSHKATMEAIHNAIEELEKCL